MKPRIYLSSPTMHSHELEYIHRAFETNWVAPLGENVNEFENSVMSYTGAKNAVALVSGTSALHLAVKLAGVGEGDYVLCSDLTFSATVNPVAYEKAVPVFIDCEKDSWNMDPAALEKAFEKYPNAKAVIVVNLYGSPARLEEIEAICKAHGAVLIEDAAESLGSTYNGEQTGTFGEYSALSFNGNKIITSSGGGMLLTKREDDAKKSLFWATQSREPFVYYQHEEIGYNYRLSNICAGIGRGQMHYLDEHIRLKTDIYNFYKKAFEGCEYIKMNPYLENSKPNFWLSCISLDPACGVHPWKIMERLNEDNIESRPIWKPMHMQPVFKNNDYITFGKESVSELVFENGLCLPSDIKIDKETLEYISDTVLKTIN